MPGKSPDLKTAVAAFLSGLAERRCSPATRRAYASDLHQLVRYAGSRLSVRKIHEQANQLLMDQLTDKRHAHSTLIRRASAYRTFMKFLVSQDWVAQPPLLPVLSAPQPAPGRKPTAVLSEAELIRLLAAPALEIERLSAELARRRANSAPCRRIEQALEDRIRDRALIELAFATGLSLGELLQLRFSDFDLGHRRIQIRGNPPRARAIGFGSKAATEAARTYLLQRAKQKRVSPQLFLNRLGRAVQANAAQLALRRYAARARLGPQVTFRSLRHTLVQRLRQRGVDYGRLRRLLGLPLPGLELTAEELRRVLIVPPTIDPRER